MKSFLKIAFGCLVSGAAACGGVAQQPDAVIDTIDAPPDAIMGQTVTGKVITFDLSGVAGATVSIQGKSAVTAANGSFSVAGVTPPFDAHIILPNSIAATSVTGASTVTSYIGLTNLAPVFSVSANTTPSKASISGSISGGTVASGGCYRIRPSSQLGQSDTGFGGPTGPTKNFDVTARWPSGQTSQQLSLVGFEFQQANCFDSLLPTQYTHIVSSLQLTAVNGVNQTAVSAEASPITTRRNSYFVTLVPGYRLLRRMLVINFTSGGFLEFSEDGAATEGSFNTPVANSIASIDFGVQAVFDTGESAAIYARFGNQTPSFVIPEPLKLATPANGATGFKAGSEFSWLPVQPQCIYQIRLTAVADNSVQFFTYTTATTWKIPDLGAQGLSPSTPYTWQVSCKQQRGTAAATIDNFATFDLDPARGGFGSLSRNLVTQ